MSPVTNAMLNAKREKDCIKITTERKYFHADGSFVKRSLRPHEWQHSPFQGFLCIPRLGNERLLNEAATLRFIAKNTDIPVPRVIPPYRVLKHPVRVQWVMRPIFCHNDLSTHNVIVDPETLKVNAIIDWEYAGYYPQEFEGKFFRRPGPSAALDGEVNDEERLLKIMYENEQEEQ
ncbi:hypothetical protein NHJ13051_005401 [Beauveria bassiana]